MGIGHTNSAYPQALHLGMALFTGTSEFPVPLFPVIIYARVYLHTASDIPMSMVLFEINAPYINLTVNRFSPPCVFTVFKQTLKDQAGTGIFFLNVKWETEFMKLF